jgi:hypothetical protein
VGNNYRQVVLSVDHQRAIGYLALLATPLQSNIKTHWNNGTQLSSYRKFTPVINATYARIIMTNNNPTAPPADVAGAPELKACPFCGAARIENWKSRPPDRAYDIWCVFCHMCSSEGPEALNETTAARLWNTRTTPADLTERVRRSAETILAAIPVNNFREMQRFNSTEVLVAIIAAEFGGGQVGQTDT